MKKFLSLVLALVMACSLIACGGKKEAPAPAAKEETKTEAPAAKEEAAPGVEYTETTITWAHGAAETTTLHEAVLEFERLLEERSGGAVQVDVFPNQQLGGDREYTEAGTQGNVDMGSPTSSNIAGFIPSLNVLDAPFVVTERAKMYEVLDGEFGQAVLDSMNSANLQGIGFLENGFRCLTTNKEIKTLADMQGVKIRVMENDLHMTIWKSVGANPSPLAFGELYTALQQKTFDAQENPLELIYNTKFYEVQPYVWMTNHIYSAYLCWMNLDKWNSLNADTQALVKQCMRDAEAFQRAKCADAEQACREAIDASGVSHVYDVDPALLAEIQAAVAPAYDMVREAVGDELVDAYFAAAGFKG